MDASTSSQVPSPDPSDKENPSETEETQAGITSRMLDVIAAPADAFDGLKSAESRISFWLIPVLISALIGMVCSYLLLSQEWSLQQIRDQQHKAMQKKFDKMIAEGKMTREAADQSMEAAEKFTGGFVKIMGLVGPWVFSLALVLWYAFLAWLLGSKILKGKFGYGKALEIAGIALTIAIVEGIVRSLLCFAMGNIQATPSPALFIKEIDPTSRIPGLMGLPNPFTFWHMAILAVGISKVGSIPWARVFTWLFITWLVISLLAIEASVRLNSLGMGS